MKRIILGLVIFTAGGAAGFLIAKKVLEKKYAQLAQEEIDSVKEVLGRNAAERLAKKVEDAEAVRTNPDGVLDRRMGNAPTQYNNAKIAYNEMAKENVLRRWDSDAGLARVVEEEDIEEDDESDSDDEDDTGNAGLTDAAGMYEGDYIDTTTIRDLSGVDRARPYLISDIEYNEEFDHHDKISLYYYTEDDVLCDENEEVVDDIDDTVGWEVFNVLETQTSAWVRNEPAGIDYEICSVRTSYASFVHGIQLDDDEAMSPREKYYKKQKRREDDDE